MPSVYLSSPTNSTLFTTCCNVAILGTEPNCPRCRQEVQPSGSRSRWSAAYGPIDRGFRWYGNYRPNDGRAKGGGEA